MTATAGSSPSALRGSRNPSGMLNLFSFSSGFYLHSVSLNSAKEPEANNKMSRGAAVPPAPESQTKNMRSAQTQRVSLGPTTLNSPLILPPREDSGTKLLGSESLFFLISVCLL